MSTDRDDKNDRDEVVSAAYRELAGETTPAHLDARVLRQAKEHAAAPYRGRVRWTQPVAWAAMIVVTLAILLEVSELPEPPPPGFAVPAEPAANGAPAETTAERAAAETVVELPEAAAAAPARAREDAAAATNEVRADEAFGGADLDAFRQAEERAREQVGAATERETRLRSVAAPAARTLQTEAACDEEARRLPERWLECIKALRADGEFAAAERELAELRSAHPELELP